MAVIKAVKSGASLGRIMHYVDKKNALTSGKDCSDKQKQALSEMRTTKKVWGKPAGRQYKHYVQSFSSKDSSLLSSKQVHEIGRKWAEKNFKGYEVFISTHTDKNHCHNHFIVNSVNYETGKKIHLDKNALDEFKTYSDFLCKEYGLDIITRKRSIALGEVRSYDMNKYQCIAQNKSYLTAAAVEMNNALSSSTTPDEFIYTMRKSGYNVDWHDNHKHITLTTPNGKHIRTTNLAKTFNEPKFTKEGMQNEFIQNYQQQQRLGKIRIECPEQTGRLQSEHTYNRSAKYGEDRIEKHGESSTQKIFSDIERKLQQLKERTEYSNTLTKQNFSRISQTGTISRKQQCPIIRQY